MFKPHCTQGMLKHFHAEKITLIYHNCKIHSTNKEKWILISTLYNDISCGMYGIDVVGGKTGILSPISLDHLLDIKPSRRGDVDASVVGQGCPVALCPGDSGLRLACGAALQGNALSHQHLRVLGLDHKTWPCWRSRGEREGGERGNGVRFFIWILGF